MDIDEPVSGDADGDVPQSNAQPSFSRARDATRENARAHKAAAARQREDVQDAEEMRSRESSSDAPVGGSAPVKVVPVRVLSLFGFFDIRSLYLQFNALPVDVRAWSVDDLETFTWRPTRRDTVSILRSGI